MNPFLGGLLFGALIIIWGICIVLQSLFGIHIPLLRIFFALGIIYIGIILIKGFYPVAGQKSVVFAQERIKMIYSSYKVIFGQAIIDLSDAEIPASGHINVTVDTAFGNTIVILPKINETILVSSSAMFASVMMPDNSIHSFGTYIYRNAPELSQFRIHINLNSIFSSVEIRNP